MCGIDNSIQVAARSKAWVCSRSLAGIVGLNLSGGLDVLSFLGVVSCQVEVSATARSFVQRSLTELGVSGCDHETSKIKRFRHL